MLRHTTYIKPDGIAYQITYLFHALCALFSLFLAWGMLSTLSEGVKLSSMPHIPLLLLLSIAATLYRDTWYFNTNDNTVTSIYGFAWFCKRETIPFSEIARLELTHFVKGSKDPDAKPSKRRMRTMVVFSLKLKDEEARTLEIIAEKTSAGRIEGSFQRIAAVTGLPVFVDRERDMDLNVSYREF